MREKKDYILTNVKSFKKSGFILWFGWFVLHKTHHPIPRSVLCAWWMGGKVKTEGLHYISERI